MNWVDCICTVHFDIDYGQIMESIHPLWFLSLGEQKLVVMQAFPDSNASLPHKQTYFFVVERTDCSLYCYSCFMQVKDLTCKRGYFQKALVLVSKLPLFYFYMQINLLISDLYLHHDQNSFLQVLPFPLESLRSNECLAPHLFKLRFRPSNLPF